MLHGEIQQDAVTRLKKIGGQVQGVSRMMLDGRYCIDVLTQIVATEAALHSLAQLIMRNHLETCVTGAFESRNDGDRKAKIDELIHVFGGLRPR